MNKKMWILSAVAVTAIATTAILLTVGKRKAKRHRKLIVISDAGYETAYDVHYPLKYKKPGKRAK